MKKIAIMLTAAVLIVACGKKKEDNTTSKETKTRLSGTIKVDGSSTVFPITEAVAEEFRTVEPRVKVTVGVSGTGGGFKKFSRGETNLSNAKLLYMNKVLVNNSLNERQKNKIVESLSKSKTVEEAKVIFDTLQSATGSTLNKKQPKSLSEAVNKTTSTVLLSRRSETKEKIDPSSDRWKRLAGINKK